VYIDDIEIDFQNKKVIKEWKSTDISSNKDDNIKVVWKSIEVQYKDQTITISDEKVHIKWDK
jgi:hypothetical protein